MSLMKRKRITGYAYNPFTLFLILILLILSFGPASRYPALNAAAV
jgi:hypothetical protein